MYRLNMDFLDTVGIAEMRYPDFHVGGAGHFTAFLAGQDDHFHAFGMSGVDGPDDIGRIARCGDAQQNIAFVAQRFDIPSKDEIIT